MGDKPRMPRMKQQWKDNAIEVEKYAHSIAEMHKETFQEKKAEYQSNPKNQDPDDPTLCPYCGDRDAGGDDHGQG